MLIDHPLLGLRDAAEFTILGDAALLMRPDTAISEGAQGTGEVEAGIPSPDLIDLFHDYLHLRDNPAGVHHELWYHEQGDRSWLVVTRDTMSHAITEVVLARDLKRQGGAQ